MTKGILLISFFFAYKTIYAQNHRFQISTGGALNTTNFSWSIAGNAQGESPNILSELKFHQITSLGAFLDGLYKPVKNVILHACYQRNGTVSGRVTDTDYDGDNRTGISYNAHFSSNKGHLETFSAGAEYNILVKEKYKLKAGVDYTNTIQNYYMHSPDIEKLQTTYRAKWQGPGFSAGGDYYISKSFSTTADFAYYFITYSSVANWNLRREFEHPVSFVQNAKGNIIEGRLGLVYRLNAAFSLLLNGTVGRSTTKKGYDLAYLTNNTQPVTQFNGAYRNYCEARMGLAINF